jgi:sigma-B regulation protein RsbU (phosphoserine phosphatase)
MHGAMEIVSNPTLLSFFSKAVAGPVSRTALRWDFANIAAAVALLTVAFAALAVFLFRRRTSDATLIYFGLFCVLYGLRLLTTVPGFLALFELPRKFWVYLSWVITCTIVIPLGLFLYQLVVPRLKILIRWLLYGQAGFAMFGIAAAACGMSLNRLATMNSITVVFAVLFPLPFMLREWTRLAPARRRSRELVVLMAGFSTWGVFVLYQNTVSLRALGQSNVEFVGLLIFVACLGYVASHRTFTNEEELSAINKELEIARQIQKSTLPQGVPALAGLNIAARYAPMSAVAGDFYDFIQVDARRVGILVADVTGHGVPAALIASMLKVAFAAQAAHAHDSALVLSGLNRAICGKFEEHFVTAAYLFVDLEQGLLRYSAAGHPPMLLGSRNSGAVRRIEENGVMLGMFPEAEYTSLEIQCRQGERCLLYTDGVFEAHNAAQQEYGQVRCEEFLKNHRELPADELADALLVDVASFSGHDSAGTQEDDITLVVLDIQQEK